MTSRCTLSSALLLLAIIGIISIQDVGSEITSEQMKYYFQTVLSHATYDKRIRPNQAGDPVRVKVSLYVIRLFDLDPDSESVKVSMYFRQAWQDERLSHNSEGVMVGGGELSDLIWKPDTMFSTSSQGSREETTLPNTFVRISPNGSVFHSVRLTQNINCQHQVRSFPMDSLSCKLQIESYALSASDLIYEWMPAGILVAENFTVNDFTVDSEVRNETEVFSLSTGNFTTISMSVRLERRALPYLIKYFAPIILTTILSMIPIGDPKNKSLAVLTSFLLTSILTVLINIHVVPKGVTVTAFDAFGFVCVIFTAVSLVFTLRKSAETEGSTYKLSDREEKCEQHMKKLLPIAFVSFLLILLIVVTCL